MPDKEDKYRKALEKILIFANHDNDGDNIEAIKNMVKQTLRKD